MNNLSTLIADLASEHGVVRERARKAIVATGDRDAVHELIGKLQDPHKQIRWEAVKALSEIADPIAAIPLVNAMHDQNADIALVAAKGVTGMGEPGLMAVLSGLTNSSISVEYCNAARYALKAFCNVAKYREEIDIVLESLEGFEPKLSAPVAAFQALKKLRFGEAGQA